MALIHFNPATGELGTCHARSPENCPFGVHNHFSTPEEAQEYADNYNQAQAVISKLGHLKENPYSRLFKWDDEFKEAENLKLIQEQLEYDAMTDEELAELLGVGSNGKFPKGILNELSCIRREKEQLHEIFPQRMIIPSTLKGKEKEYYDKIIKDLMPDTRLKKPVYAIWVSETSVSVWNKDQNYFDVLTYHRDGRKTSTEIKDLRVSAQITAVDLKFQGLQLQAPTENNFSEGMLSEISKYNPHTDFKQNKLLSISKDEQIEYFIKAHASKDCTKLVYTDNEGKVNKLWLKSGQKWNKSMSEEEKLADDVKRFKEAGLDLKLWIRLNKESLPVKEDDIAHFKEYYKECFSDGVAKDEFTLKDLKFKFAKIKKSREKIGEKWNDDGTVTYKYSPDEGVIRIGEFVYKGTNVDYNQTFKISDFERYIPKLMGEISMFDERNQYKLVSRLGNGGKKYQKIT